MGLMSHRYLQAIDDLDQSCGDAACLPENSATKWEVLAVNHKPLAVQRWGRDEKLVLLGASSQGHSPRGAASLIEETASDAVRLFEGGAVRSVYLLLVCLLPTKAFCGENLLALSGADFLEQARG